MSRRSRAPRRWAHVHDDPTPLVAWTKAGGLHGRLDPADRRALMLARCVDLWAPAALGPWLVDQVRALAAIDWIRCPTSWRGPPDGEAPMVALCDHLVRGVKYPLPAFLYPLTLGERVSRADRLEALQALAGLGSGGALRDVVRFTPLTRREQHELWLVPVAASLVAAIRAAQVRAAGGPDWLIDALCRTVLARRVPDEHAWRARIALLARGAAEIDAATVGPLVDYLGHTTGDPPRTIAQLRRAADAWHQDHARRTHTLQPDQAFRRSGLRGGTVTGCDPRWTFTELSTHAALVAEGAALRHCVATYAWAVASGRSSIWSMRFDGERRLTLEVWNRERKLVQARGLGNRLPHPDERAAFSAWAGGQSLGVADR